MGGDRIEELGLLRHILQRLGIGIAVADTESGAILLENAKFFDWFPAVTGSDESLDVRMPGLDAEKMRKRFDQGRSFPYETEVRKGARTINLAIDLRRETVADGRTLVIAECRDVSKQKEAEYMLDSYSRMSEKNARELQREKERVEKLLLNIMPRSVYEEMKNFGATTPHKFESASVLMLDFVDFTEMAVSRDPSALIAELNDIFSAFDRIVDLFGCERIKTIGDAYVAVSGVPEANPDHASNIAKVALRMRRYLGRRNASHANQWQCRVGIATGPLIGSLVGIQKYVYDVFGPAVNLAARLEQLSEPMQITLTQSTYEIIRDDFMVIQRGEQDIKGFGRLQLFILEDENRVGR
jgi:class 3 adenylate cyclase